MRDTLRITQDINKKSPERQQKGPLDDTKARLEALDPTQSFIVQAPAGSGKTGLLTQRFLVLLSVAETPEACLAITFTRKAALEMRDRVVAALQKARNSSQPTDPYEAETWRLARSVLIQDERLSWDLLQNPGRLKVLTIDAFCASLARQMPVVSQLGAVPRIEESPSELYQMAARNLLKSLESNDPWSASIRVLLSHLDNNLWLTERLLADMLSHRDQWLPHLGRSFSKEMSRQLLENGLKAVIQDSLNSLVQSIPPGFETVLSLARYAASNLALYNKTSTKKCTPSEILACDTLLQWPGNEIEDLPLWQGLAKLLLTEEHAWRKTVTEALGFPAPSSTTNKVDKQHFKGMKEAMQACLNGLTEHTVFRDNLQRMHECPPPVYDDAQWQVLEALVQLLPVLTAQLSLVFQEMGVVDFTEMSLAASKALGDEDVPTDLALGLDYKIQHILVDEFQDTSLSQFRLLEKLTLGWQGNDGRTLFLVGDPMQSIYRFRQAEVGLFLRAKKKGINGIPLKSLTLTANFRSDPIIVDWINTFFEEKFPKQDDILSSAIAFNASTAMPKSKLGSAEAFEKAKGNIKAEVQVIITTVETEFETVVGLVKKVLFEDPLGSHALLVRSRSHLQNILPALRAANIHYQGVQLETLTEQSMIQDLLCLTRALIHLGDRIAWLGLLRTPWINLSLTDLWAIANHQSALPIWHTLQTYTTVQDLTPSAHERLSSVVPVLVQALSQYQRLPLRSWIMQTWEALGGNQGTLEQGSLSSRSIQDLEAFFSILDETSNGELEAPGVLETRLQAVYAKTTPSVSDTPTLQIMTVHKAKGLEFDSVIVPGINRRTTYDPSKLLLWEERIGAEKDSYLMLAPIKSSDKASDPLYSFLRRQEATRAAYETTRLWYVAATRARSRLYWLTHE